MQAAIQHIANGLTEQQAGALVYLAQNFVMQEEIQVSTLFVDIAGFTKFAENTAPHVVAWALNEYFQMAGEVVQKHGGVIQDYFGDGFLAVFGLDREKDHSNNLLQAGLDILIGLKELNRHLEPIIGQEFNIRLGAHRGPVVYQNIGAHGMKKKAAIGDTVNFSSRLEEANKNLGTQFLISQTLFEKLSTFPVNFSQHIISVKGKKGTHVTYAVDICKNELSTISTL